MIRCAYCDAEISVLIPLNASCGDEPQDDDPLVCHACGEFCAWSGGDLVKPSQKLRDEWMDDPECRSMLYSVRLALGNPE